ncbi:MAG: transglutaminase-like domain-containing protein [Zestosphaera sp.]
MIYVRLSRDLKVLREVYVVVVVSVLSRVASALVLMLAVSTPYVLFADNSYGEGVHEEFVFVDVARVLQSSIVSEGYFETPINYSEPHYIQAVKLAKVGGDVVVEHSGNRTPLKILTAEGATGYVVLNVSLTRNTCRELGIVAQALYALNITKVPVEALICMLLEGYEVSDLPPDTYRGNATSKYVMQPNSRVVEVVVPRFEGWLRERLPPNYSIADAPRTYVAVWAAYYVYGGYLIRYEASSTPRSLDEVLEKWKGDCDDMSRVLLNLLWYYGVPAKIQYGYVYIESFDYLSDFYGSLTRFVNAGPHAYVVSYVPNVGWVSVDLLAWARLIYPTLITGETTYANMSVEELKAIEDEYSAFRYVELVEVHEASRVPDALAKAIDSGNLLPRLEELVVGTPQAVESITTSTLTETPALETSSDATAATPRTGSGDGPAMAALLLAVPLILAIAVLFKVTVSRKTA